MKWSCLILILFTQHKNLIHVDWKVDCSSTCDYLLWGLILAHKFSSAESKGLELVFEFNLTFLFNYFTHLLLQGRLLRRHRVWGIANLKLDRLLLFSHRLLHGFALASLKFHVFYDCKWSIPLIAHILHHRDQNCLLSFVSFGALDAANLLMCYHVCLICSIEIVNLSLSNNLANQLLFTFGSYFLHLTYFGICAKFWILQLLSLNIRIDFQNLLLLRQKNHP